MADQADKLRQLAQQVKAGNLERRVETASVRSPFENTFSRVIAVSSGKGGVGKTNFSINFALSLCELGKQVVLFDADLGMANADVLLGMSPKYNLQHFIQGSKPLHEIISVGPLGLKVIASGNGISRLADMSAQDRERVLSHFSLIEDSADYIIVDTGAGISKNVLSFAMAADECVVVTTPEPTARLDAYGFIKILSQQEFTGTIRLIVNMADSVEDAQEVGRLMQTLAQRFLNIHIEYFGCIRRDKHVNKAVQKQTPFVLAYPQAPASLAVKDFASRISNTKMAQPVNDTGLRSFFEKIGKMFS